MEPWIDRLLTVLDLSAATRRQYASALRYWAVWYDTRYGEELPFTRALPARLTLEQVDGFYEDHTPVLNAGVVKPRMSLKLREALEAAGFNGHGRCPAASTTLVRVSALQAAHRAAGIDMPAEWLDGRNASLTAAFAAEQAAGSGPQRLPAGAAALKARLLSVCDTFWDTGAEDATLILLSEQLTLSQVMALTYGDVHPGTMRESHTLAGATCVWIPIHQPATDFQHLHPHAFYVGEDADVMSSWGSYLQSLDVHPDSYFIWGSDRGESNRVSWAERRWRNIAAHAGFGAGRGRGTLTPRAFRAAWESEARDTSAGRVIARRAALSDRGVRKLLAAGTARSRPSC